MVPAVRVPVLSVKRMFMLPAVSMPTSLRTMTLSRFIRSILADSTTAIIMGSPSGTATTTMAMASNAAWNRRDRTKAGSCKQETMAGI